MYKKNTYIGVITEIIDDVVMSSDRDLYSPYFYAIEEFCSKNKFMIGGKVGIDIMCESALTRNDFFVEIYGPNIYDNGRKLVDSLYLLPKKHIDNSYIELKTDIPNTELTVFINLRRVCKIYYFDLSFKSNTTLLDIIKPNFLYGFRYKLQPIPFIPEELQLIDIYRDLYNPSKNGQWRELFETSQNLYKKSEKYLQSKISKDGGEELDVCPVFLLEVTGGAAEMNKRNLVLNAVRRILKFLKEFGVIIGDFAIDTNLIEHPEKNMYKRLQFLIDMEIDDVVGAIKKLITDEKIIFKAFKVNIITDFRIKKWSLYIDETSVCDIFNSPAYEMIPFEVLPKGYKIGSLFVLIRFKFIDMWIMRLIRNLESQKKLDDAQEYKIKNIENKISVILRDIADLDKKIRRVAEDDIMALFQLDDYYGVFIPDDIAKKKLIKQLGFGPSYYPTLNPKNETAVKAKN